ncbi:MAG: HAMP domain-containing histidine kinase [Muribaculaceae bacterium]|nr:HAMP domain-containing histidine kinase [Muribaculaceae bacterium]
MIHIMRFICLLLAVAVSPLTHAQNNAYGIDDDFYKELAYANNNINSLVGLEVADSLYKAAKEVSDGKTMCLALTIPMRHYSAKSERDSLMKYAELLGQTARETGNLQYYYFAENFKIVFDINQRHFADAIANVNRMWETAFDVDTVAYGRFAAMEVLGHLYTGMNDRDMAIKQYKDAFDYMKQNVAGQDPSVIAWRLTDLYLSKGEVDSAEVYCDFALKNTRTQRVQLLSLMHRARILFAKGDMEGFGKAYKHAFERIHGQNNMAADSNAIYLFMIDKAKVDGDKRVAMQYASRIKNKVTASESKAGIYEHFGEYDKALHQTRRSQQLIDSLRSELMLDRMSVVGHSVIDPIAKRDFTMTLQGAWGGGQRHDSFWMILFVVLAVLFAVAALTMALQIRHGRALMAAKVKEVEDKANDSRLAVEMAERVRATAYVQTIGRNMRNPLNAVVGFSQLMSDTDSYLPDDLRKRYSRIIRANSNLLMALVDDMTDLAELEVQMRGISLSEVCPNAVVRDAIAMFEASAYDNGGSGVCLQFNTEIPDDYTIKSDPAHLRQVINQLLSNAEKFTNNIDGGTIKVNISLSENLGWLTISVADTGIGVPPDKAEDIFEKFVKLNKSVPGNGLGLCIARLIITHLDGEIYLDTAYTDGARFVVLLPVGE